MYNYSIQIFRAAGVTYFHTSGDIETGCNSLGGFWNLSLTRWHTSHVLTYITRFNIIFDFSWHVPSPVHHAAYFFNRLVLPQVSTCMKWHCLAHVSRTYYFKNIFTYLKKCILLREILIWSKVTCISFHRHFVPTFSDFWFLSPIGVYVTSHWYILLWQ